MVQNNKNTDGIVVFKQRKAHDKARRIVDKRPKWRTEKLLTEQDIDEYIEKLKNKVKNDAKVAIVLLKWLELKKKSMDTNLLNMPE